MFLSRGTEDNFQNGPRRWWSAGRAWLMGRKPGRASGGRPILRLLSLPQHKNVAQKSGRRGQATTDELDAACQEFTWYDWNHGSRIRGRPIG
jgi:hypothetical protein